MKEPIVIGLFGFGVVGEGIYQVLRETPSLRACIKKICIRDPSKARNAEASLFTTDPDEILRDPEISLVVELINDAGHAWNIVSTALENGKDVVSANKKMIAEHLGELLKLREKHGGSLLYEAAVCGSIPIIRNLEEYYDNELLHHLCGIVNGSTNFILTKVIEEGMDYASALAQAQALGFAETDPSLDVKGVDAANKLSILLLHAYGLIVHPADLLHLGIDQIHPYDSKLAGERGLQVKLCAQARKLANGGIAAFVMPQFLNTESRLYGVKNEFNGVVLQSAFADKQFLYGKGAGRYPTSMAVLSDISALRYSYKYEYRKHYSNGRQQLADDFYLRVYVSFDEMKEIDVNDFAYLDEFHCHGSRKSVAGVISFSRLRNCPWARANNISVILCEEGVVEDVKIREAKERSLRLAGVVSGTGVREEMALIG
jgi:homoserine dehydrogenase